MISDAPVIQHESRKLCLSFLFGTRKNKVSYETSPTAQLPHIIQVESRRRFLGITSVRREVVPMQLCNDP